MTAYLQLIRFSKPIGVWLLMFPCWWGLALASSDLPSVKYMLLFSVGAFLMRGAGCTYNDIVDRKIDTEVERTSQRPVASGKVSLFQAYIFLISLLLLAFLVLLQFSLLVVALGASSLLLVAAYPWMKRITYWPQLFLGFTFNWGAILGWAAVRDSVQWPALLLYMAGICWTLGYDTIYAHQDKEDDLRIGVKSSALALGKRTKPFLGIVYGAMVVLIGLAGYFINLAWPFYIGLLTAAFMLLWQILTLQVNIPANCWKRFSANGEVGLVVFASIVMGVVFH